MSNEFLVEKPRRFYVAEGENYSFHLGKVGVESVLDGIFRIPTICANQQAREERGYYNDISQKGNWTREGILYQKRRRVILPTGLCYLHSQETTNAQHEHCGEYTLEGCTSDELDRAISEGLEINVRDLNSDGNLFIPCKDFGSNEYALFLFGGCGDEIEKSRRAEASGQWLIDSPEKIKEISLNLHRYSAEIDRKDYATQVWFGGLKNNSEIRGDFSWSVPATHRLDHRRILGIFDQKGETK